MDMNTTTPPNQLAELIDNRRRQRGWSDPEVAARALRAGHQLSKSNLSRIRNRRIQLLDPKTVWAIAAGIDAPAWKVVVAALATLELPCMEGGRDVAPEQAIEDDFDLLPATKEALQAILSAARATETTSLRNVSPRMGETLPIAKDQHDTTLPASTPNRQTSKSKVAASNKNEEKVSSEEDYVRGELIEPGVNASTTTPGSKQDAHNKVRDLVSDPNELGAVVVGDTGAASRAHEVARRAREAAEAETVEPSRTTSRRRRSGSDR